MKYTAIVVASFILFAALQTSHVAAKDDNVSEEFQPRLLKLKLAKKAALLLLGLGAAKLAFVPLILTLIGGNQQIIYYYYYVDEFGNPI